MIRSTSSGISVVIPVHNGGRWIGEVVSAVLAQRIDRPLELLLIDDCSSDDSAEILRDLAVDPRIRRLEGEGRGAAAAINVGLRHASHDIICQIDQDVVIQPEWLARLVARLDDSMVAGAQGYYISAPDASVFGRVMNLDLEQRYAGIDGAATDHVCTGNTAYRAAALVEIGGFDESLGYGYDNDVSYRLIAAGYRLVIDRNARAVHRWREGLIGYLIQQYGFGYGRIDLIAKHPRRAGGDAVSPIRMIAHPLLMTAAAICALVAIGCRLVGWPWQPFAIAAAALVAALAAERCVAGIAALRQFGDPIALAFPPVHLARDLAWVTAIVVWVCRRIFRRPGRPAHSMRGRLAYRLRRRDSEPAP